ncbi:MAG: oxygen-independent coproporphyrinogen III oxidase [Flavobacteriaceae bacterium]
MSAAVIGTAAAGASVPRYTSYPTAPHFRDGEGDRASRGLFEAAAAAEAISAYVHIPFCDRLCWFCGCHTKQVLRYGPVADYVGSLVGEIGLVAAAIAKAPPVAHLHLGGGSPSMLSADDAARIREAFERGFGFTGDAEICIEIDPSDSEQEGIGPLLAMGVTRASIGVQDFDPRVQRAINRIQTYEQTARVVGELREAGVGSVNIDALYGLPHQTMATIEETMARVVALAPDRVALFGYAHVPWVKKHQRLIPEDALPGPQERLALAARAAEMLAAAGYERIGIDHFARPGDSLAAAAREGTLRRNFQGYTTDSCDVLVGFGASAIGRYPGGYVQNIVATSRYRECVDGGRIPAGRGYMLSRDDVMRGHVIERLMCDFAVSYDGLRRRFGGDAESLVGEMEEAAANGLAAFAVADGSSFRVRDEARAYARIVASRFDAYLDKGGFRFSKAV